VVDKVGRQLAYQRAVLLSPVAFLTRHGLACLFFDHFW